MPKIKLKHIIWVFHSLIFLVAFPTSRVNGQSHELIFASHEVVSDLRTSLKLTDQKALCFDKSFEISFELSFLPGYQDYFGYIFRLIKDDKYNIDLVYDFKPWVSNFNVIVGNRLSTSSFHLDSNRLFNGWTVLRFRYDKERDQLTVVTPDKTFTEKNLGFAGANCYKLVFGVNRDNNFKTLDVPPMKIRNIKITEGEKLTYRWPLDDEKGKVATEAIDGHNGVIDNPVWVLNDNSNWKPVQQIWVSGPASVAFDALKELLFIVGADSLYSFSVPGAKLLGSPYSLGKQNLLEGNQSLYSPFNNQLYNFYIDQKLVSTFDFTSRKWDKAYAQTPITDFWHVNKFFSPADTSIYIIGGYGHFVYKNTVQRYHIPTAQWDSVPTKGDRLLPRYLAALGTNEQSDTAYLIGGYGSVSGQQIVNPKNHYDMVVFDVRSHHFKKLFELKVGNEDFAFANSLVIDPETRMYYGLIYPNDKFSSSLQLIKGSLTNPAFVTLGKKIPYSFHDIRSFADLFFCPVSQKFLAVTIFREDDHSVVSIFTLASPPVENSPPKKAMSENWLFYAVLITLILGLSAFLSFRFRRKKNQRHLKEDDLLPTQKEPINAQHPPTPIHPQVSIANKANKLLPAEPAELIEKTLISTNAVYLFGDMQLYDEEGNDVTRFRTPLLKELFLLILLYTLKNNSGVSSDKLNEMLWFDKDEKSARNNQSVNIAKLRNVLEKMKHCQITKTGSYWKIEIDYEKINVDYVQYLLIIKDSSPLTKQKVSVLTQITQRGGFLSNTEYNWLDPFKSDISNNVIDTYLRYAHSLAIADDPELLTSIATAVFYFDPVNEEAMVIKCKALAHLGKHSLAKDTFEHFKREYKNIYGENFTKDFAEILL